MHDICIVASTERPFVLTAILYKLKLGEIVTTIPTIGEYLTSKQDFARDWAR